MAWLAPCSVVKESLLDCFSMIIEFFPLVCLYSIKRMFFFPFTISAFQGQWTINWMQCKTGKKTPANQQCMDQYFRKECCNTLKCMSGRKWGLAESKNQQHQRRSSFISGPSLGIWRCAKWCCSSLFLNKFLEGFMFTTAWVLEGKS